MTLAERVLITLLTSGRSKVPSSLDVPMRDPRLTHVRYAALHAEAGMVCWPVDDLLSQ